MIEVVYEEEKKEAVGNESFFRIPKNIRQIGEISAAHKIYMEDYAHTFLVKIAEQLSGAKIGLLLGQSNWTEGITYIFIKSALQIEQMDVSPEHIVFTDEIWQQADDKIKKYFSDQEVVGWFFVMPECTMELTDVLYRTHLNYFGGNNKLLYMMEPLEKEEAFFQYENGCMGRQKGFYLYYDKNEQMQEYMIEMGRNTPIEDKSLVKDKAVQDFRKIISGKPAKEEKEKGQFSLIHAIGVCVIVGAIAVGITYLNSYQKLEETSVKVKQTALRVKENTPGLEATTEAEILSNDEEQGESLAEQTEEALPEDTEGEPEGQAEDAAAQGQELVANGSYVVQKGDTLSNISKRVYGNDSQVKNICQLNNLRINDTIYPGQIILLP